MCAKAYCIGIGDVSGVGEPAAEVVERGPARDVVHHERSRRVAIERPGQGEKALISRRVPDLQFNFFVMNLLRSELAERVLTPGHKLALDEPVQQARFAHAGVADDDVLEDALR